MARIWKTWGRGWLAGVGRLSLMGLLVLSIGGVVSSTAHAEDDECGAIAPELQSSSLVLGTTVGGQESGCFRHRYTLELEDGQAVRVDLYQELFGLHLRLLDPDGERLAEVDDLTQEMWWLATAPGSFAVEVFTVERVDEDDGRYELTVIEEPADVLAEAFECPEEIFEDSRGPLAPGNEIDTSSRGCFRHRYSLDLGAESLLRLAVTETGGELEFHLLDADDSSLGYAYPADAGPEGLEWITKAGGIHQLIVTPYEPALGPEASYRLEVSEVRPAEEEDRIRNGGAPPEPAAASRDEAPTEAVSDDDEIAPIDCETPVAYGELTDVQILEGLSDCWFLGDPTPDDKAAVGLATELRRRLGEAPEITARWTALPKTEQAEIAGTVADLGKLVPWDPRAMASLGPLLEGPAGLWLWQELQPLLLMSLDSDNQNAAALLASLGEIFDGLSGYGRLMIQRELDSLAQEEGALLLSATRDSAIRATGGRPFQAWLLGGLAAQGVAGAHEELMAQGDSPDTATSPLHCEITAARALGGDEQALRQSIEAASAQQSDASNAARTCAEWALRSAPDGFGRLRQKDRRAAWRLALYLAETLGQASESEALRALDRLTASHSSLFVPALYFRLPRDLRQERLDNGYLIALARTESGRLEGEQKALKRKGQLSTRVTRRLLEWLGGDNRHRENIARWSLVYREDLISSAPAEPLEPELASWLQDLLSSRWKYKTWVAYAARGLIGSPETELRRALADGSSEAVESLGQLRTDWALELLDQAARSSDPEVRLAAAEAAWERGDRGAQSILVKLAGDRDPDVREAVAFAFGRAQTPAAVSILLHLSGDSSQRVREAALDELEFSARNAPPGDQLPRALGAALRSGSIEIRELVLSAASEARRPELVDLLFSATGNRSKDIAEQALDALVDYARAGLVRQPPPRRLRKLLDDPELSSSAARLLGRLGDDTSQQMLFDCLATCRSEEAAEEAAFRLARLAGPELEAPLVELLQDASDSRARRILWVLEEMALGPGIEAVNQRTGAASEDLAITAIGSAQSIARRGFEPAVREALLAASFESRAAVREAAAGTLGVLQGTPARLRLVELLQDSSRQVRLAAAAALARHDPARAEPVVCSALEALAGASAADLEKDGPWSDSAGYVFRATESLNVTTCVDGLFQLLEHPTRFVRVRALDALLRLGISMSEQRWLGLLEAHPDSFGFRGLGYQLLADTSTPAVLLDQLLGEGPSCSPKRGQPDDGFRRWQTAEDLLEELASRGRPVAFDQVVGRLGADSACTTHQLEDLVPWLDLSGRPGVMEYLYGEAAPWVISGQPSALRQLVWLNQNSGYDSKLHDALSAWRPTRPELFTRKDLVEICSSEYDYVCRDVIEAILEPVVPTETLFDIPDGRPPSIAEYLESGDGEALAAGDLLELFARTRVLGFVHAAADRPPAPEDTGRFAAAMSSEEPALRAAAHYLVAEQARRSEVWGEASNQGLAAAANAREARLWSLEAVSLFTAAEAALAEERFDDAIAAAATALVPASLAKHRSDFRRFYPAEARFWHGLTLSRRGGPEDLAAATAELELAVSLTLHEQGRSYSGWWGQELQRLEVAARTFLGGALVERGRGELEEAIDLGREVVAASRIDEQAEDARYLGLARQRLGDGDVEGAQALLEELALRRARDRVDLQRLRLANPERNAALAEYQRIEEQIAQLAAAAERASAETQPSRESAAPSTDTNEALRLQRELAAKRRELRRYVTKLQQSHPELAALLGARPTDLATLLDELPAGTLAVQYLLLPERLVLFVLGGQQLEVLEVSTKPSRLAADVAAVEAPVKARLERNLNPRPPPGPTELERLTAEARAASARLTAVVLDPLRQAGFLTDVETLIVLPNGALHSLSFGSLPLSEEEDLIDRYRLVYASSTSMLQFARSLQSDAAWSPASVLSIGDPDGSLPGAAREAQAVTALVGGPPALVGAQATHLAFASGLGLGPEVVHLATHATVDPDSPQGSALLLADGDLEVDEVWGLPMDKVRLTTLSACETGVGTIYSGDDLISLETAFLYAGSESVLATRWKVDDRVTEKLMTAFYTELASGASAAEALRRAQREIRERYPDEYYWAGFTFHGAWW